MVPKAVSTSGMMAAAAMGTFVSALTENQIIAYLATFGALLICYLMNGIKSLFTLSLIHI